MSAGGVDEILNYTKNEEEDYYAVLGVDEHSSVSYNNLFAFLHLELNECNLHC